MWPELSGTIRNYTELLEITLNYQKIHCTELPRIIRNYTATDVADAADAADAADVAAGYSGRYSATCVIAIDFIPSTSLELLGLVTPITINCYQLVPGIDKLIPRSGVRTQPMNLDLPVLLYSGYLYKETDTMHWY